MRLGRHHRRITMMCGWLAIFLLALSLLAMGYTLIVNAEPSVGPDDPLRTPMPSDLPSVGPTPTRTRTATPTRTRTPTPTSTHIPCVTTPTPGVPFTGNVPLVGTEQRQVVHCADDAFVTLGQTNALDHDGAFLRMGGRPGTAVPYVQYIDGFLFRDVRVPQGARVVSATLRLETWYQSSAPVLAEVAGQLSPQASDFSPANPWPQQRPKTALRTAWTISAAMTGTVASPDLAGIVEEIVGQSGWQPGNNLALLISPVLTGQHFMDWQAYDFSPANAAQLTISYETPPATITPTPTATASASPTAAVTPTGTPTLAPTPTRTGMPGPGLIVRGHVRRDSGSGAGLAGVSVQVYFAGYPWPATGAVTDAGGTYETALIYIPGDEMITVKPVLPGAVFEPPLYYWRHYAAGGVEEAVRDFAVFGAPSATETPTPTLTPASSATFTPTASPRPEWRTYFPLVLRD